MNRVVIFWRAYIGINLLLGHFLDQRCKFIAALQLSKFFFRTHGFYPRHILFLFYFDQMGVSQPVPTFSPFSLNTSDFNCTNFLPFFSYLSSTTLLISSFSSGRTMPVNS